ncbi:hypothetical protein MNBD_CHLOROFLEXI01-3431 [hydrothermal vent metagenome]|uniref:Uncharacterized protein n=1 Tax=hydrothermal vent metagenome TaxID=652676 RepID=A0A3B0V2B9_9ZZZZ
MTVWIELKDNKLIEEAQTLGHHESETETIVAALQAYIERHQQNQILNLFGTIEYDPTYDYKVQRQQL